MPRAWRWLIALGVFWTGCAERSARPTVVLVSLDTTRADHLGLYGYERPTSPYLDRLARQSRVFEAGVPSATWTLPSHASMFTGLDPAEHGSWVKLDDAVDDGLVPGVSPELPLLTTRLAQAGYYQLAAVGGPFTSSRYGLLRDFDAYLDPGEAWERPASELNAWLFARIDARPRDRPLFVFVNYFDAHAPYDPPPGSYPFPEPERELLAVPPLEGRSGEVLPPELVRDALDQYDRELLVQDRALEALMGHLEQHGLLEDALVLVVGDHGEMFGEQAGVFGHGGLPFEGVARVPLLVHRSGGPVDRVAAPVSLTNIPRTVLAELGLLPLLLSKDGVAGRFSLLDLPEELPAVYCEERGGGRWVGVLRTRAHKLGLPLTPKKAFSGSGGLFFDLAADPDELAPQAFLDPEALPPAAASLYRALEQRIQGWAEAPANLAPARLSETELQRLYDLGYGGR